MTTVANHVFEAELTTAANLTTTSTAMAATDKGSLNRRRPFLVFGSSPNKSLLTSYGEEFSLGLNEVENVAQVQKFHSKALALFPREKRPLRRAVFFNLESPLVIDVFIRDTNTYSYVAVENAFNDLSLHDIEWTPLHLAAFLNQSELVEQLLQLDGQPFTLRRNLVARTRHGDDDGDDDQDEDLRFKVGYTCVPDSQGRLPIDIVFWKKETMKWHVKAEMERLKYRRAIKEVIDETMVSPELVALLSPLGEVTTRLVEDNCERPLDAAWQHITTFIIFQTLIVVETLIDTNSSAVQHMCIAVIIFVVVCGYLLYLKQRLYGPSNLMPIYYFYNRLLLSALLFLKSYYAFEAVNISQLFLGIATLVEDFRMTTEGMEAVCFNYGRRKLIPEDSAFFPIGTRIMEFFQTVMSKRSYAVLRVAVEWLYYCLFIVPFQLTFFFAQATAHALRILFRILVLRGIIPQICCWRSRNREDYRFKKSQKVARTRLRRWTTNEKLAGVSPSTMADGGSARRVIGGKLPFTDCTPCGLFSRRNLTTELTRDWVENQLLAYELESPDVETATDKVDLFIGLWCATLSGDLFFLATVIGLMTSGPGG